jgi:hypothetical protein
LPQHLAFDEKRGVPDHRLNAHRIGKTRARYADDSPVGAKVQHQ